MTKGKVDKLIRDRWRTMENSVICPGIYSYIKGIFSVMNF